MIRKIWFKFKKILNLNIYEECPINTWFELSYAHWLTVPRLILESMPYKWKKKMAKLLLEMDDTFNWRPEQGKYYVIQKDDSGKFISLDKDICDYRRGDAEKYRIRKAV